MRQVQEEERICRHFGECGGCKYQDIPYALQLENKEKVLSEIFSEAGIKTLPERIIASPQQYYYRNKMEFSFSDEEGKTVCGLHSSSHRRRVTGLSECRIFSENIPLLLPEIEKLFTGLSVYSTFSYKGFLRHLVLRESKHRQGFLVNIVVSSQGEVDRKALVEKITSLPLKKPVTGIILTVNNALSDTVIPDKWEVLYGSGFLEEEISGLVFKIYPYSFFQVNPYILNSFYSVLKEMLSLKGEETVLDLFSGVGAISLVLSKSCGFVWAIEQDADAVDTARENALLNGIKNTAFLSGDVRKVLYREMAVWRGKIGVITINPPRSGLSKKVIKRVVDIRPEKIAYSSCNPRTFSEDIKMFLDDYSLEIIQPFDFFPHTPHMEVLALLTRRSGEQKAPLR